MRTELINMCAADDATSPPPAGPFAFSRQTSRQPFAAIQLQALPTEALAVATAGDNRRQQPVSPPKQFSKQARSRYAPGSSRVILAESTVRGVLSLRSHVKSGSVLV